MGIDLLFRIAGIGLMVAVLGQVLKQSGRDEIATLAALAGLVIVLLMIVDQVASLFDNVRRLFQLY